MTEKKFQEIVFSVHQNYVELKGYVNMTMPKMYYFLFNYFKIRCFFRFLTGQSRWGWIIFNPIIHKLVYLSPVWVEYG